MAKTKGNNILSKPLKIIGGVAGFLTLLGLLVAVVQLLQAVNSQYQQDDVQATALAMQAAQIDYQAAQLAKQDVQITLGAEQNRLLSQRLTIEAEQAILQSQLRTPLATNSADFVLTATAIAIESNKIEATRQAIEIAQQQIEATQVAILLTPTLDPQPDLLCDERSSVREAALENEQKVYIRCPIGAVEYSIQVDDLLDSIILDCPGADLQEIAFEKNEERSKNQALPTYDSDKFTSSPGCKVRITISNEIGLIGYTLWREAVAP